MRIGDSHKNMLPSVIKILLIVLILIIAYLFALNGRYIQGDDEFIYFDKWTKSILEITRYKTVE